MGTAGAGWLYSSGHLRTKNLRGTTPPHTFLQLMSDPVKAESFRACVSGTRTGGVPQQLEDPFMDLSPRLP